MSEEKQENPEIVKIKDFIRDDRFDDAVQIIALYLGDSTDNDYLDRLEEIIELLLTLHGGRTVLRFLIEQLVIDIPSLLENLSKKDSVLRYSFLLLLKNVCENECDLFLPFSDELLKSEDPNVREAALQLLIFMAGGDKEIEDEELISEISNLLMDQKPFVIEKAIQALKAFGTISPSLVTRIIKTQVKENPDNEELKQSVDNILKAIVSVEKIDEIVEEEEEEVSEENVIKQEETQISDKELELKKKEIELKKKKLELEEKEKQIEEKLIQEKEKKLKLKEESIEYEVEDTSKTEDLPKKIKKKIKKEENEIIDKEIELKKKDLEIKKKKIELDLKEKELEEIAIQEREKALKIKEELIEKESELSQVELELHQKKIEEKEQKIKEDELKRAEKKIDDLDKPKNH
jgi:hypothetical protein